MERPIPAAQPRESIKANSDAIPVVPQRQPSAIYTKMGDVGVLKAKDDDDSSSKMQPVSRRWAPKANVDLPPTFVVMANDYSIRSLFSESVSSRNPNPKPVVPQRQLSNLYKSTIDGSSNLKEKDDDANMTTRL